VVFQRPRPQGGRALFGGDPNPVVFLENEILYGSSGEVPKGDDFVVPIGKARVARSGRHVTFVAWSNGMTYALKAAAELANEGIEAEVIDLRTLRPMDTVSSPSRKAGRSRASVRKSPRG